MAEIRPLVRKAARGYPEEIRGSDVLVSPAFKASNSSGVVFDANGGRIIGLPTTEPLLDSEAVSKKWALTLLQGFHVKTPVRVASRGNVNISSPGIAAIDGITLAVNDRVLLKDQTDARQNGIYLWKGSSSPMVRAPDADEGHELPSGTSVHVKEGSGAGNQANSQWVLISPDTETVIGTSNLIFEQFQGAGELTFSGGLVRSGNTVSIDFAANGVATAGKAVQANDSRLSDARTPTGSITAGNGLIGGGALSSSPTIHVGAGNGIRVNSDSIEVIFAGTGSANSAARSDHTHTAAEVGAVPTNRTVTAGDGLTGGGALSANITLNVNPGPGITTAGDRVSAVVGAGLSLGTTGGAAIAVNFDDRTIKVDESNRLYAAGVEPDQAGFWRIGDRWTLATASQLDELTSGEETADHLHRHEYVPRLKSYIQTGEAVAVGDVLSVDLSTGLLYKARADDEARANVVGIAETVDGSWVELISAGEWSVYGAPMTPGEYFLGATGGLVPEPPTSGRQIRVGYAVNGGSTFIVQVADFGSV